MALRRPSLAVRTGTGKKVCLGVVAASVVSGMRPPAARAQAGAGSTVAELKAQLAQAEQRRVEAERRRDEAEQRAELRVWSGRALGLLLALVMCGILSGIVPRAITRALPPAVVEVIKQALNR